MPRYADHQERRDELADAVRELILEHGIDRVSVRSVAQKSGWSVGAIRYYFPKQEDLLVHALRRTLERAYSRMMRAEQLHPDDPLERSVHMILAIAPVNLETRQDLRIWIAFLDRGMTHGNIAKLMHYVWETDRFYSRRMVASFAGLPIPTSPDEVLADQFMEETATVLHIMWDGIAFQSLRSGAFISEDEIVKLTRRVLITIWERVQNHLCNPLSTT